MRPRIENRKHRGCRVGFSWKVHDVGAGREETGEIGVTGQHAGADARGVRGGGPAGPDGWGISFQLRRHHPSRLDREVRVTKVRGA
jgi:hypothetical protein